MNNYLLLTLLLVNSISAYNPNSFGCLVDQQCPVDEYCKLIYFSSIVEGICLVKSTDGDWCLFSSRCKSNYCSWLRCTPR